MNRRSPGLSPPRQRWLTGVVLLVALGGCSSPAPPASGAAPPSAAPPQTSQVAPPFPALTDELRLDGVDPCSLLTPAQETILRMSSGKNLDGDPQQRTCDWASTQPSIEDSWQVYLYRHGQNPVDESRAPIRLVPVEHFTAQAIEVPVVPSTNCYLNINVAQEQFLAVAYLTHADHQSGITFQQACDQAVQVATMMIATLRSSQ